MKTVLSLAALLFLCFLAVRLLLLPMRWAFRMLLHTGGGFLSLWLLNTVSGFTGILLPVNPVTVVTAGFLGLPGIGGIALLELLL